MGAAVFDGSGNTPAFNSFVLGCTACLGYYEEQESQSGRQAAEFGFPKRQWEHFVDGRALVKDVDEVEIRYRLRTHELSLRGMHWSALRGCCWKSDSCDRLRHCWSLW